MNCLCSCRGRKRRRTNRVVCLSISVVCLLATSDQANAFHRRTQREGADHVAPERRRGALLQSSLQSLLKRGASKWGEHVPASTKDKATTSLKKSSSLYISQLHRQIQKMQSKKESEGRSINIDGLKRELDRMEEEGSLPQDHFTEEILAVLAGGITAGSAFAAATAGAFVGTALMALGAIATVVFTDSEEDIVHSLVEEYDALAGDYGRDSNNGKQTNHDGGCDFNGEDQLDNVKDENRLIIAEKRQTQILDSFMLEELQKCYNGIPEYAALRFPRHDHKGVCVIDGHDSDTIHSPITKQELSHAAEISGKTSESTPDLGSAIEEDVCISSDGCNQITPTVEDAAPKRVEVVWHDAYAGVNIAHFFTDTQSKKEERPRKRSHPHQASPELRPGAGTSGTKEQSNEEHWTILTDAERDGALLLSESFRVASTAFGIIADAVRFSGETAAAATGGAARLAGGAVRVSGWAVGSLGDAIENSGGGRGGENSNKKVSSSIEKGAERGKMRKRKVAGTSVRLIGDAIEQVADSLLFAGSATERVAFAAAGAAEGTVRIVEDIASSLSDMFSKEVQRGSKEVRNPPHIESSPMIDEELELNVADRGAVTVNDTSNDTEQISWATQSDESGDDALLDLVGIVSSWVIHNIDIIIAQTEGVPSLAAETLGVLLLCFLISILLLSPKKSVACPTSPTKTTKEGSQYGEDDRPTNIFFRGDQYKSSAANHHDHDSHSTITAESTVKTGPHCLVGGAGHTSASLARGVAETFLSFLMSPLKLAHFVFVRFLKLVLSKEAFLLVFFMLGWIFLSRVSQYKSSVIQRKSELRGYKLAIESIGESRSVKESAFWLNTILFKLWRVEGGGLEPRLSSSVSAMIAESLNRPFSKPSVIAHVALDGFTFGSSPPIVSRVEMKGVDDDRSVVSMDVDVGMLLHDAVLLLDIKPSSLEYQSLPSTKISINSLDARATLSVSIKCSPDYPYVSFLDISLADIPDFNLRIEPQSESGLKGIDFGSFPIVSKWIKSSISAALAKYLSPQYISIDILAWLTGNDKIVTYHESER
mmetsp:Transcript_10908/g.26895  ORF Transcript_10908/g.26895 Transcript_10908/m.26895 type:complete len:1052 (+) Transcript_10908:143-3298(+)